MPVLITELLDVESRPVPGSGVISKLPSVDDRRVPGSGSGRPLPRSVHLPFILDAVLREVPFASGKRLQIWRSIVQSTEFQDLRVIYLVVLLMVGYFSSM